MSTALICRDLTVAYGEKLVLKSLDLRVESGETIAILGPSGSGKTTLLYALAGFIEPQEGVIEIAGAIVVGDGRTQPPEKRDIGLVFQNYALWPHLDAVHTVAYPLRRSGMSKRDSLEHALKLLDAVGISELGERRPSEMSGGQQQRVGLARALARDASLYLFDEPTAHLDATVREAVRSEIARHRRERGAAAIYATHDSGEAMAIADRVLILRDGEIIQDGTPQEIYERPLDVWAARLTGPASLVETDLHYDPTGRAQVSLGAVELPANVPADTPPGRVQALIRPEWVSLGGPTEGIVEEVWFRGPHTDYRLALAGDLVDVRVPGPPELERGQMAGWTIRRCWIVGQMTSS